jgi:hypothetical protein
MTSFGLVRPLTGARSHTTGNNRVDGSHVKPTADDVGNRLPDHSVVWFSIYNHTPRACFAERLWTRSLLDSANGRR